MKITLWMATSLNGIIATSDNREDFLSHDNWLEFVTAVQQRGCLIWGRKTYELVKDWGSEYLDPLKDITKIILSTNKNLQLNEGFTVANSPQQAIEILTAKGFTEVILTGGSTNNTAFAKLGLIDEVIVDIEGIIIGKGIPLFNPEEFELPLELIEAKKITTNILQVHYLAKK